MGIKSFFNFCYQRQLIWHKKEIQKLPAPWTQDPILQRYLFCNIYRELDASSKHLISRVIDTNMCLDEKIFNIIWFRFFNTRDFFDKNPPRHWGGFRASDYTEKTKKNCAIIVGGALFQGNPVWKQIHMIMELAAKRIPEITRQVDSHHSLQNYCKALEGIKGLGPFLRFQCAQDIAYAIGADDWDSFIMVGPGAKPGLEIIFPEQNKTAEEYINILFYEQTKHLTKVFQDICYKEAYYSEPWLSAANIQHACCEYRKWCFLTQGKGRRRIYGAKST